MTASGQPGDPRGTNDQRRRRNGRVPKAIRSRWFAAATVMAGLVVVVSGAAILGPWTTEPTNVEPTASPRATTAASQQPSPSPSPSAEPLPSLPPLSSSVTVVRPTAGVLSKIQDMKRLESVTFHMERVIDLLGR